MLCCVVDIIVIVLGEMEDVVGDYVCCCYVVDMFCVFFGIIVVNLVVMLGVCGGVYIGGGIVLCLGLVFVNLLFWCCFEDKGCFLVYVVLMLVYVIYFLYLGLIGFCVGMDYVVVQGY